MKIYWRSCLGLVALLFNISCAAQDNMVVLALEKRDCSPLLEDNIISYQLCQNWQLDSQSAREIISNRTAIEIYHPTRDMSPFDLKIYYQGQVAINHVRYDFSIFSTSWIALYKTDSHEDEQGQYFACLAATCSDYFLGNYSSEALAAEIERKGLDYSVVEQQLMQKILKAKQQAVKELEALALSLKREQSYSVNDSRQLNLSPQGCQLIDRKKQQSEACFAIEHNNLLYIYNPLTYTGYETEGNFLFKIAR